MKTGRNEPCPCGSGKKYKKCCINKFDKQQSELENDIYEKTSHQELSNLKSNPELWAMLHIHGRNPKNCTCKDCADSNFCKEGLSPEVCCNNPMEIEFG